MFALLPIMMGTNGGPWQVQNATYTGKFKNLSGQDGIAASADGTTFFSATASSDAVYQSTLSTAWDVSTAGSIVATLSIASQDASVEAIRLSQDGTKLYVLGEFNNEVFQYTLPTPWSLSGASYASKSVSVLTQEATARGLEFSTDGTKMYVCGFNKTVYQYALSTAWDVSTASYASKSFSVTTQETSPVGIAFSSDGAFMFVVGTSSNKVHKYALATAWDVSTAVYTGDFLSVLAQSTSASDLVFSPDGDRMYLNGFTTYQYQVT